jgi:hypothetical protein
MITAIEKAIDLLAEHDGLSRDNNYPAARLAIQLSKTLRNSVAELSLPNVSWLQTVA